MLTWIWQKLHWDIEALYWSSSRFILEKVYWKYDPLGMKWFWLVPRIDVGVVLLAHNTEFRHSINTEKIKEWIRLLFIALSLKLLLNILIITFMSYLIATLFCAIHWKYKVKIKIFICIEMSKIEQMSWNQFLALTLLVSFLSIVYWGWLWAWLGRPLTVSRGFTVDVWLVAWWFGEKLMALRLCSYFW